MLSWLKQCFSTSTSNEKMTTRAHILVVDPSVNIRAVLAELLKAQHYQVTAVEDGSTAQNILKSTVPDLVLIEVKNLQVDGSKFITQLKKNNPSRYIPVIVTSNDEKKYHHYVDQIGAEGFLEKPFSEHKLLDMLTSLLTKKGK